MIKSLSTHLGVLNSKIEDIELLGSDEKIKWERNNRGLIIKAPQSLPTQHAHAFKIMIEGYTETDIGGEVADHVD